MDSLPLEIIANIACHIPKRLPEDLDQHTTWDHTADTSRRPPLLRPAIASLSRKWQVAVEPYIYRSLEVKNTELAEFASIFRPAQSHRRAMLKALYFDIVLPTYSDADCALYESDQDRLANDTLVSNAIAALFKILSAWESHLIATIALFISVYSPMDRRHRRLAKLHQDLRGVIAGTRTDLFDDRHAYSFVRLLDPDGLPAVPCLASINAGTGERKFHPASLVALTRKAPAAQIVIWKYTEPGVYLALRRPMRDEFAQSLETFRPAPSTRQFCLHVDSHAYKHRQRLPNLVSPHRYDRLCSAIHWSLRSSALHSLSYTGQVDPSLFWPYPEGEEPRELLWPSLTRLIVNFDIRAPCGRWYFCARPGDDSNVAASDEPLPLDAVGHMPPGYGSEEDTQAALAYERSLQQTQRENGQAFGGSDDFRTVPNDALMLPLLEAFARAISLMPALQYAALSTPLPAPHFEWFVAYAAPRIESNCGYEKYLKDPGALSAPRVFFHMQDWRPSKRVVNFFREAGRRMHQQDIVFTFLPPLY